MSTPGPKLLAARGERLNEAQHVLAGLRVEAVVQYGIGGIEGGRGLDGRIADADLAVVADAQLAPNLERDSREGLMRAHLCLHFHVPAGSAAAVCAFSRSGEGSGGFGARRVAARAMKHLTGMLFALFSKFGGFGLLVLGIL